MSEYHWMFISAAYGLTAAGIVAEIVALSLRRRRALARVARERDLDEADD